MANCESPGLLPIADAIEKQRSLIKPLTSFETLEISKALGRILSNDIQAPMNVPSHDNSAMDGYALNADDYKNISTFVVVGTALAGHPFQGKINQGECVRIMTGANIPNGTNSVVMQENVEVQNEQIRVLQTSHVNENVRPAGGDIKVGSVVVKSGTLLAAQHLSLLSSMGVSEITVIKKPVVGVFSTGDELVEPGTPLNPGQIYESNRIGLVSMLRKLPVEVIDYGLIPDDSEAIAKTFIAADDACDWVISSGGVSVGDADYVKNVLDELGEIDFWKVAIKPGKPYAFGKLRNSLFSGLPGNPVSSFVTFHQLVTPCLQYLCGQTSNLSSFQLKGKLSANVRKRPGRADYQRGNYAVSDSGEIIATPLPKQGSNIMSSFTEANCYLVLAADSGNCMAGDTVSILPFDHLLQ